MRYYAQVSTWYSRLDFATKAMFGLSVIGAITDLIEIMPREWQYAIAGAFALLLVLNLISNLSSKAAVANGISHECEKLENRWKDLWAKVEGETVSDEVALEESKELVDKLSDVTERDSEAVLWYHKRLNIMCEKKTEEIMGAEYV